MDVLLLCGYFEPKYQAEINGKTKTWVENARALTDDALEMVSAAGTAEPVMDERLLIPSSMQEKQQG